MFAGWGGNKNLPLRGGLRGKKKRIPFWVLWKSQSGGGGGYVSEKIIAFFGSLYLPSLNPFIVRCFVTAVLSLILLTSAYPPLKMRAGTSVSAYVCFCVYTRARTRKKRSNDTPAEENRNSCRLGAKKIRATAAVWAWHGSALSFQLPVTVRGRGLWEERTQHKPGSSYCLLRLLLRVPTQTPSHRKGVCL